MHDASYPPVEISVIVPCYNQESYIAETLDSVLAQTFERFEIIVVNDGSRDDSWEIIQRYASRYPEKIVAVTQESQGVIASRNNAIRQARGTYIYPLDGDDKMHPDCLQLLYDAITSGKGDVIYSDTELFGDASGIFELPEPTKNNMVATNCVVCSALYRKADWEQYGGYDMACSAFGFEDWDFWLNFVHDNKTFYKVQRPLFLYRQLANSRNAEAKKRQNRKKFLAHYKQKHKRLYYTGYLLHRFCRFFFQKKVSKDGKKTIIKVLRIPVFRSRG